MKTLSKFKSENIKSISESEMTKNDGIELKTLRVEFMGIENDAYKLISAEFVTESKHSFSYTERIGDKFSGLGSSDGMRDEFQVVNIVNIDKKDDPSMRRYTYLVKKNGKIVTSNASDFNLNEYN